MSDILDAPDGLDGLDDGLNDGLTEDLLGDVEQDEDSSLLDAALGDVSTVGEGEKEPAITPTEDPGDSVLDETNDSVQLEEEDPVCV